MLWPIDYLIRVGINGLIIDTPFFVSVCCLLDSGFVCYWRWLWLVLYFRTVTRSLSMRRQLFQSPYRLLLLLPLLPQLAESLNLSFSAQFAPPTRRGNPSPESLLKIPSPMSVSVGIPAEASLSASIPAPISSASPLSRIPRPTSSQYTATN